MKPKGKTIRNKSKKKPLLFNYARYSSTAFQMIIIILAGVFLGFKLDELWNSKPVFSVIFIVIAVVMSIYSVIYKLLK